MKRTISIIIVCSLCLGIPAMKVLASDRDDFNDAIDAYAKKWVPDRDKVALIYLTDDDVPELVISEHHEDNTGSYDRISISCYQAIENEEIGNAFSEDVYDGEDFGYFEKTGISYCTHRMDTDNLDKPVEQGEQIEEEYIYFKDSIKEVWTLIQDVLSRGYYSAGDSEVVRYYWPVNDKHPYFDVEYEDGFRYTEDGEDDGYSKYGDFSEEPSESEYQEIVQVITNGQPLKHFVFTDIGKTYKTTQELREGLLKNLEENTQSQE